MPINSRCGKVLAGRPVNFKPYFPTDRVGKADYVIGSIFLGLCFALFLHPDIHVTGQVSEHYLFGSALDLYEECKKRGYTCAYPPPTFLINAAWLYPFKLAGLITGQHELPLYLAYWLKALTTVVYIASGVIFYRVASEYFSEKKLAQYAAIAWLAAPLALFSQLIFSQQDIFYVLLTMAGFLMFLRSRPYLASLLFGGAITFKYFPLFAFIPLLLLHEKRERRILTCLLLFALPILIITVIYGNSPAFLEQRSVLLHRIYAASLDTDQFGYSRVYLLPLIFFLICGLAYFTDVARRERARVAAYIWLTASVFPFVFILWHPQWMMFVVPPIVLTSMICDKTSRFLLLDLIGMFLFVATTSLIFENNVDAVLFRRELLGLEFSNTFPMAKLFSWFGDQSRNVFHSGFCGYLALQAVLKYRQLLHEHKATWNNDLDYGDLRRNLYIGLMLFLLPACTAIYRDITSPRGIVRNAAVAHSYELVSGRGLEQSFVADGKTLTQVRLFMSTSGRMIGDNISVELIDSGGSVLGEASATVAASHEIGWHQFSFVPTAVSSGVQYSLRVKSAGGLPGNAFALFSSLDDSYKAGAATVDGTARTHDFAFEIVFER